MDTGLFNAIGAMNGTQRSLDVIAHNLANIGTHGYKRRTPSVQQFRVETDHGSAVGVGTGARIDFSQGDLTATGSAFHLALEGDGFFAVESPQGEVYTRYGGLSYDANGVLTTYEGYPLAWEQRLTDIDPAGPALVIDTNGQVTQGAVSNGRLKLAAFENPERLRELPYGYWAATPEVQPAAPTARVIQGSLERSNATGVNEMILMIETQRAYDVAARTVRSIDQSYQRLAQTRGS